MSDMQALLNTLPQAGTLMWIGIRLAKKNALTTTDVAQISAESGLDGDHYRGKSKKRQVTLIQREHLDAVGNILGKTINPGLTRRNLVVEGINLLSLNDRKFRIGDEVVLETTGVCHPCSRMEENLGAGGYNAMRGHGGITATVVSGGTIKVGDAVKILAE
jgi:MOSC domain-containing protein YiiM